MRGPRHFATACLLAACALAGAGVARGASDVTGAFPRLDTSARSTALGGNLVALAGGCEAIRTNPAGLLGLAHREAAFTYSDLFGLGLVKQSSAQLGLPRARREVQWADGQIRRVPAPAPADRALGLELSSLRGDLGTRNYLELQFSVAFAWSLTSRSSAGVAYHLLSAQSGFPGLGGSGHALDFGLQRPLGPFTLGVEAANLLSTSRWKGGSDGSKFVGLDEPFARRWSLGLAWQKPSRGLSATVQADWIGDSFGALQHGTALEWRPLGPLALRAGFRERQDATGWRREFSAGAGARTGPFRVDYGWQPSGHDLGDTHRWTAGLEL